MARSRSSSCEKNERTFCSVSYRPFGIATLVASTPFGSKPGSTCCRRSRLRTRRPAPMLNIKASATSPTTRRSPHRRIRRLSLPPRPPSLRASSGRRRLDHRAGAMPNNSPLTVVMASTYTSTTQSNSNRDTRSIPAGWMAWRARVPHQPNATPVAPPSTDITRLSVSACLTSRRRPAPRARRKAASRSRPAAFTSIRLPTFAQAMSSRSATAPRRTSSGSRVSPTRNSCSGVIPAPIALFVSG